MLVCAIVGALILTLAGLIFYDAATTGDTEDLCRNGSTLLLLLFGIGAVLGGFCLVVAGTVHAIAARSWSSGAVPFAGLALLLFGFSCFYSFAEAFSRSACD